MYVVNAIIIFLLVDYDKQQLVVERLACGAVVRGSNRVLVWPCPQSPSSRRPTPCCPPVMLECSNLSAAAGDARAKRARKVVR